MARYRARACSLLALALAVLCAVAAAEAKSQTMSSFEAYLRSGNARTMGTDESYDEGYPHNYVDLVETLQKDCRYLGEAFGYKDVWASDVTCRQELYGHQQATIIGEGASSTGACRWTVEYFMELDQACGWVPLPTLAKTYVIGTATARCTFPRGDACGEPLCNSLVVTVSGEMYATEGYTRSSTGSSDSVYSCGSWQDYFSECDERFPFPGITNNGKRSAGGGKRAARKRRSRGSRKHAQDTPVGADNNLTPQKKAEAAAGIASTNYGYHGDEDDEVRQPEVYYPATALVISGSITSINGQRYTREGRYTDGTLQYVPFVFVEPGATAATSRPQGVILTPQSYTLDFVKDDVRCYSN